MCVQVLVLQSLQSNGTCLRHLAPLTGLKQLSLQGQLSLTWAGIECLAAVRDLCVSAAACSVLCFALPCVHIPSFLTCGWIRLPESCFAACTPHAQPRG